MNYTIVPMNTSHIPQVEEIERACFPDPWSKKLLEDLLAEEHALTLAAVAGDGAVLGYVSLSWVLDEGYISNVAVAAPCRRQGIGAKLMAAAVGIARQEALSLLTLEVRVSNTAAIALYERYGFTALGRRRGFYRFPREDAYVMTLFLEGKR